MPALAVALVSWVLLTLTFAWLLGYFETYIGEEVLGVGLFFSSTTVYVVFVGTWVIRESGRVVAELPLACSDEEQLELVQRITRVSLQHFLLVSTYGLVLGVVHTMIMIGSYDLSLILTSTSFGVGAWLGTMIAWFLITHIVVAFIDNARTFARIGAEHLTVDLLRPKSTYPLGRAALLPTLCLIGTQAMYPLIALGGDMNLVTVLPGFGITLVALVYLFLRSTFPLHRRLSALKAEELERIDRSLQSIDRSDEGSWESLNRLLTLRDHMERTSEWPFKLSTIARWSLYLTIPPLTWVGAALIENVVDFVLN